MISPFGILPDGQKASLYTISGGSLRANIADLGATLVSLWAPDANGNLADVVLGYDEASDYLKYDGYLGAVVGRNANRIKDARFPLGDTMVVMTPNENGHNLHSGPNGFHARLWTVEAHNESSIRLSLVSPDGDQGFPGNAKISVTYSIENNALVITYEAVSDKDTVFNMTNHAYFNMAGHENTHKAMDQVLMMPGRFFNPDDAESIPTGELCSVEGTPMDFRQGKPIGQDIEADYEPLHLQEGYDHNFEACGEFCAVLSDPESGRTMKVSTDCPGIQFYSGNYLNAVGKGGINYHRRGGICLETQFYPDSVNHPEWPQPFTKAGQTYHSVTRFQF